MPIKHKKTATFADQAGAEINKGEWNDDHTNPDISDVIGLIAALAAKQDVLVSATNIKTINGISVLGSGNLVVGGSVAWGAISGTLSAQTDLQTALDAKVAGNTAITGATKTKVTYDAKGLVTAGADATTADIADSSNKRYVTDANLVTIGNQSGTNTGDQTSVTGNAGTATALQTARTINGVSFDGTGNITVAAAAGTLSGATLAAGVTASSLTSLGAQAQDLNMNSHKITNVTDPVSPQDAATKAYVDTAVTGLLDYRGSYDASTNLFPATGGSGLAGAVLKGDFWICSVSGTLGGVATTPGDLIIALIDTPAQTAANWDVIAHNLGAYVTSFNSRTGAVTPQSGDYTTAIVADSSNKRYVTDAQLTVIGNTSGTNTGDQTSVTGNAGTATKWATARNLAGNSVDGSAAVAFANKFIVQGTADAGLSAAQFLGALGTGILKNTTTTGVLSIAVAGDFPTLNQTTTGSAATLTTPSAIGINGSTGLTATGVNFDGSAAINMGLTGTLIGANGGTAQSTTAIGDLLQGITGNSWAKLAAVATGNVLISGGVATASSWGKVGLTTHVSGTLPVANGGTGVTASTGANSVVLRNASANITGNNITGDYTTIATAAGTTTLTVASTFQQYFTGVTTQICVMPVVTTLTLGHSYWLVNNSTGAVTINSSGGNLIMTLPGKTSVLVTCILITGTTAASWSVTNDIAAGSLGIAATAGSRESVISAQVLAASSVTQASSTPANITSISLPAGDYDVYAEIGYQFGATTTITSLLGSISPVSAVISSLGAANSSQFGVNYPATVLGNLVDTIIAVPSTQVLVTSTTTIYLVTNQVFGVSTCKAYGKIWARLRR